MRAATGPIKMLLIGAPGSEFRKAAELARDAGEVTQQHADQQLPEHGRLREPLGDAAAEARRGEDDRQDQQHQTLADPNGGQSRAKLLRDSSHWRFTVRPAAREQPTRRWTRDS